MTISIIHFSDIHISNSSDLICKRLEKIEQACLSYLPKKGLIIIAISGDNVMTLKIPACSILNMFPNIVSRGDIIKFKTVK